MDYTWSDDIWNLNNFIILRWKSQLLESDHYDEHGYHLKTWLNESCSLCRFVFSSKRDKERYILLVHGGMENTTRKSEESQWLAILHLPQQMMMGLRHCRSFARSVTPGIQPDTSCGNTLNVQATKLPGVGLEETDSSLIYKQWTSYFCHVVSSLRLSL